MKFTPEQQRAICETGDLLVAAAAGAGKTAVLTERIAAEVIAGADVGGILVVTFTNAAAAQMRKRIEIRLRAAWAQAEDPNLRARLQGQLEALATANISTLHAFCMHVLRRHFQEAGLDPAFALAEETQAQVAAEDALDELLEVRFESGDAEFLALADLLGGEDALIAAVHDVYDHMRAEADPRDWLDRACAAYETDAGALNESLAAQELLRGAKEQVETYVHLLSREREALGPAAPSAAGVLEEDMAQARALLLPQTYDSYRERLAAVYFSRLTFPRGFGEEQKKSVQRARADYKKLLSDQREKMFCRSLNDEAAMLAIFAPAMRALRQLMIDFDDRYEQAKAELSMVDFSDLEHKTLAVLRQERVAASYREQFGSIYVDEYQDINRVQEAILQRLRGEGNLFLVGDVKQSIYRFRLADPGLFLDKHARFGRGEGGRRIDLAANFRSAPRVIDAVNSVFGSIMSPALGEVDYGREHRLVAGRQGASLGNGVEFHLIARDAAASREEDAAELENTEITALAVARRIREMMERETLPDEATGLPRPCRYGDFALLLRSTRAAALAYTRVLALEGIPAYAELTGGYFDAVEVAVFLNLLRLIDNRRQDVPLVSVLRSPMGGFTAEELLRLRQEHGEGAFIDILTAAGRVQDAAGEKARAFLARLDRYRRDAAFYGLEEFLGYLLEDTGYYLFAGALPGGPSRQANLEELLRRAHAYEKGRSYTLAGFLRFMDRARSNDGFGAAQTSGMDVVRVLSVHKSKGLEFPVVIVAGLERRFLLRDLYQQVLPDTALGLGLRVAVEHRRAETLYHRAIAQKLKREIYSEEMRLLYVALTRARERLLLVGSAPALPDYIRKHDIPCDPVLLQKENSFLGWLVAALLATPEGNPLRQLAELPLREGGGCVDIVIHDQAPQATQGARMTPNRFAAWAGKACRDEALATALKWTYPHLGDTRTPIKLSVSGLTKEQALPAFRAPAGLLGDLPLTAAGRGSASHKLLERIPIEPHTPESVAAFLARCVERGWLLPEEARAVRPEAVAAFFASPLGSRLTASPRVQREWEFLWQPPREEAGEEGLPLMLQGVIDCCFLEDGRWVLLDYKTDAVRTTPREAALPHAPQLRLYARALAQLTGTPVAEGHVFLLAAGESVRLF